MKKSAAAFRTISEVGEILDVPAHVLRFWESKFSQIKPVKRGGGRRYYRPEDVGLIRGIQHLLYDQGMTIKGAQKVMSERGIKSVTAMGRGLLENTTAPPIETPPAPVPDATPAPVVDASPAPYHLTQAEIKNIFRDMRRMRRAIRKSLKAMG